MCIRDRNYTSFGFRTKMLGSNPFAAQYSGVNADVYKRQGWDWRNTLGWRMHCMRPRNRMFT